MAIPALRSAEVHLSSAQPSNAATSWWDLLKEKMILINQDIHFYCDKFNVSDWFCIYLVSMLLELLGFATTTPPMLRPWLMHSNSDYSWHSHSVALSYSYGHFRLQSGLMCKIWMVYHIISFTLYTCVTAVAFMNIFTLSNNFTSPAEVSDCLLEPAPQIPIHTGASAGYGGHKTFFSLCFSLALIL